jgi:hypothetical protein
MAFRSTEDEMVEVEQQVTEDGVGGESVSTFACSKCLARTPAAQSARKTLIWTNHHLILMASSATVDLDCTFPPRNDVRFMYS